ncbi:MAG: hypothetical protein LQ348_005067 [Seirophora lacunosa]|nr:MAG: hypothetical protein LQ348_005067 [Seirophora lacunosa]
MTDPQEQHNVFNGILQVLQRIEAKLETHETRVKHVEDLFQRHRLALTEPVESSSFISTEASSVSCTGTSDNDPSLQKSTLPSNVPIDLRSQLLSNPEALSVYSRGGPKIRYSAWRSEGCNDGRDEMLDEDHSALLKKYIGDCAAMPDDGRLPLNLGWRIYGVEYPSERRIDYKHAATRRLEALRAFDAELRAQPGNDFLVVDFDTSNNSRIYRVGQEVIGDELLVSSESPRDAPWSRLILYQGMTTGSSMKREFDSTQVDPVPYFKRAGASTGLWNHIFPHLQLKRRSTTSNPYANSRQGFHTTFYDIRETKHLDVKELWKQGPLYDHPLGWHFRRCAYTLYCPLPVDEGEDPNHRFEMTRPHWTMLVLSPAGFFDEHNGSFPIMSLPKGRAQALGHCLGRLTRAGAELNLIAQGLARISERWADFQSFFDYILDDGDSLMQPADHDNLLFDDGSFSRSRRYFWAINCLSEFETAITDNITQWELYKSALPILDNDLDNVQYRHAELQCRVLQNQREYFRQKLAATRALRDALFNASAVIESRASTRLVIVVVALLTYTTVLNINSIVTSVGRLYDRKKRRVINAMKKDERDEWKTCGQRFESFRPKHENPKPSEWYITLYAALNPAAVLGLSQWSQREITATRPGDELPVRWFGIPNRLWRRQKNESQSHEQQDEAWVF